MKAVVAESGTRRSGHTNIHQGMHFKQGVGDLEGRTLQRRRRGRRERENDIIKMRSRVNSELKRRKEQEQEEEEKEKDWQ